MDTLNKYIEDPLNAMFGPGRIAELEGSTAPTLIGGLQYVRKFLPTGVMMENVEGVRAILPLIEICLRSMGYQWYTSPILDPSKIFIPNHRPRIYFGGLRGRKDKQIALKFTLMVNKVLEKAECVTLPLNMFLLDPNALYLQQLSDRPPTANDEDNESCKWPEKHVQAFSMIGRQRPSASELEEFKTVMPIFQQRWFSSMTRQMQDSLVCIPIGSVLSCQSFLDV